LDNSELQFAIAVWVGAFVDAGIAVSVRYWQLRSGKSRLINAASEAIEHAVCILVAMFAFLCQTVWAVLVTGSAFAIIHALYAFLVVVPSVYLILVTVFRLSHRTNSRRSVGLILLGLIPPALFVYASFVEPYRIRVERATLPILTNSFASTIRLGVLSDLQTRQATDYERKAVQLLLAEMPDIILLPGDYFQVSPETFANRRADYLQLLSMLKAPGGVFAVLGDSEHRPSETRDLFADAGIRLLENEVEVIQYRGTKIALGGIELNYTSPRALRVMEQLDQVDADLRILISHRPDSVFQTQGNSNIDLVVAGHTHGGQVVLPVIGPLMTLSKVPRKVAAGGLHRIHDRNLYVSRGVGMERGFAPPIRFLCPPEISLLQIRPTPTTSNETPN
jgi:uncharacterized protein